MTQDIFITLMIVLATMILLFSEKLRVDLVALLVLGALVVTGLLTPTQALSGFSNPAVVTVWAVFILSGGLSRTGIANMVGRWILQYAGSGEIRLLLLIMVAAGLMSAFMNNVGVAAMLLPVVVHVAKRTGRPASKLLMPLAFGALLGGLTTLIGTPPNIIVSDVLREYGYQPFSLFDFTPVGAILMILGILFIATFGRLLLPKRDLRKEFVGAGAGSLREVFELGERLFILELPSGSKLDGIQLSESRIGSATGLTVIGIMRNGDTILSPSGNTTLNRGDRLLVTGRSDRMEKFRRQRLPFEIDESLSVQDIAFENMCVLEAGLSEQSNFIGKTLAQVNFRQEFNANVVAIMHGGRLVTSNIQDTPLSTTDILIIQVTPEQCDVIEDSTELDVKSHSSTHVFHLQEELFAIQLPEGSSLDGKSLEESRLGDAFGLTVLGILRGGKTDLAPHPSEVLGSGDTLLVEGRQEDLSLIRSLQGLSIDTDEDIELGDLESEQVGLVEAVLAPKTSLAGQTLRDILFREKFGLNVLAIWGDGRVIRSDLRDRKLKFGDVLLLHGPRDRLKMLSGERDFLVLSPEIGEMPRSSKAPVAALIMAAVVLSVLVGWLPIAIAAVIGASLMVLTGCLTMDEAYRNIDWRAVFLIAGMLPLGLAMEQTGTANYLASAVIEMVGDYGSTALITGLFILTTLASQIMPNAVVAVLMAPIAINTAVNTGISPYALMMVIAISASASFLSPVAHPANILVMGPGGYRFKDYLKLGIPLTIVVLILTLLVLPIFWPLAQ